MYMYPISIGYYCYYQLLHTSGTLILLALEEQTKANEQKWKNKRFQLNLPSELSNHKKIAQCGTDLHIIIYISKTEDE